MDANIGIDLGTYKIAVCVKKHGIVFNQPSIIAYNIKDNSVVAIGNQAYDMVGKTPKDIKIIRPFLNGVINDYDFAEKMLLRVLDKVCRFKIFKPKIAVCVSSVVTDIERNAVIDLAVNIGARKVFVIDEPIAAALGVGVDILKPKGRLIVDVGAGSCDVALISMGGVVAKDSVKIAGDDFDEAVMRTVKNKYSLRIGLHMAREIKHQIGAVVGGKSFEQFERSENLEMIVSGKDILTGFPKTQRVHMADFSEEFDLLSEKIVELIKKVLKNSPPDLLSDIQSEYILITGGTAKLRGLKEKIEEQVRIKAFVPEKPSEMVAVGLGKYFDFMRKIDSGVVQTSAYKK